MKALLPVIVLALLLACHGARGADGPAPPPAVVEDTAPLPVTIKGRNYALDVLVARLPGEAKLPVALITHGSSDISGRYTTIEELRGWAHQFAQRGWLAVAVMRRGYGNSEGEVAENSGSCRGPDIGGYLDAHADDLEAALRSIGRRGDADMGRVLAVGHSAGGAAVMALAGRPSVRLAAAINISGGLTTNRPFERSPACTLAESDLVWNFARFGVAARMPTLWLYAENDSLFRPGLVGRLRAAFTHAGGRAELVMLPPFRDDGHALFDAPGGRTWLLPDLDRFRRAHGLPTWDEAESAPLLARLPINDGLTAQAYLQSLSAEKALALAPGGGAYWSSNRRTAAEAQRRALARCKVKAGVDCTLAFDNFRPLIDAPPKAAHRPEP